MSILVWKLLLSLSHSVFLFPRQVFLICGYFSHILCSQPAKADDCPLLVRFCQRFIPVELVVLLLCYVIFFSSLFFKSPLICKCKGKASPVSMYLCTELVRTQSRTHINKLKKTHVGSHRTHATCSSQPENIHAHNPKRFSAQVKKRSCCFN